MCNRRTWLLSYLPLNGYQRMAATTFGVIKFTSDEIKTVQRIIRIKAKLTRDIYKEDHDGKRNFWFFRRSLLNNLEIRSKVLQPGRRSPFDREDLDTILFYVAEAIRETTRKEASARRTSDVNRLLTVLAEIDHLTRLRNKLKIPYDREAKGLPSIVEEEEAELAA